MLIMGYAINQDGCQSASCVVRKPTENVVKGPCQCIPKVDVATKQKIATRLKNFVRDGDLEAFKERNNNRPGIAWSGTCPVCGNSTWSVLGAGSFCDTAGCSHTSIG